MYTLRNFRANTKEAFDSVDRGEEVLIERSGSVYALIPAQIIRPIKTPAEIPGFLEFKACKHGADPEFCRFAKNGKPCKM